MCDWVEKILQMNYVGKIIRFIAALTLEIYLVGFVLSITSLVMFKKRTSAENLRSIAFDEIIPFRKFIIKDDTSALL